MKLVVNLVLGLNRAVLAEGLALARACGLDPSAALEILRAGPAASRVMDVKGAKMLSGDFTPQARLAHDTRDAQNILKPHVQELANKITPAEKAMQQAQRVLQNFKFGSDPI